MTTPEAQYQKAIKDLSLHGRAYVKVSHIPSGQTLRGSFVEAVANVVIGLGINLLANSILLPLYGWKTFTWKTNLQLGVIYTIISILRSFFVRRIFNAIKARWNHHG